MKKQKGSLFRKLRKLILWFICVFLGSTFAFTLLYRWVNPPITPLMIIRYFQSSSEDTYRLKKDWVSLESMSPSIYRAAIASEDNLFLEHHGFDFKAIGDARDYNKKHQGKKLRGASTISQQTAKNVFLWPQRSFIRKGLEVYFTGLIELLWTKERILEVYLNVIETGKGIYGFEAASQVYYKKAASKVKPSEAAMMLACIPNPLKRRPDRPTSYLFKRQGDILRVMGQLGPLPLRD